MAAAFETPRHIILAVSSKIMLLLSYFLREAHMGQVSARRSPRYNLAVDVEMSDILLNSRIWARTRTLSRFGCGVESYFLFSQGTSIAMKFCYKNEVVNALGRVVYSSSDLGMGLAFSSIEQDDERILERWLSSYMEFDNQ